MTFALAYRYYHDKQLLVSNLIDQPIPDTAKLYLVPVRMPAQLGGGDTRIRQSLLQLLLEVFSDAPVEFPPFGQGFI
jgi:hypothetical protein